MHIQLKFDCAEAEWYGEMHGAATMPTQCVIPCARHQHNVPLSVVVANMRQWWPNVEVAIDHDSLIAYKLYKAMRHLV